MSITSDIANLASLLQLSALVPNLNANTLNGYNSNYYINLSNTALSVGSSASSNTIYLQGALNQANSDISNVNNFTQSAFNAANNVTPQIQPAFNVANTASANTIYLLGVDASQNSRLSTVESNTIYLQGALNQTNSDIVTANTSLKSYVDTELTYLSGINTAQNTRLSTSESEIVYLKSVNTQQNTQITDVNSFTQSSYNTANTKFNSSGGNITGAVTVSADLLVTGNLTVSGNVTSVSANNLSIQDNMIYLNANNYVTNPDLGFAGNYNDGTYRHTGFFRDASDGVWKVFDNYLPEPDASPYIDTSNSSFRIANFQANTVIANVFSGSGASLTSIPNSSLNNSSITLNGTSVSLGSSGTIPGSSITNIPNASLTNNSISVNGTSINLGSSGTIPGSSITNIPNASLVNTSITLNGTSVSLGSSGTIPGSSIANIPNASLVNTTITINGTTISLGNTGNIIAGAIITDDTSTNATRYVMLGTANSGNYTVANTSSSKLYFNPGTGVLFANAMGVNTANTPIRSLAVGGGEMAIIGQSGSTPVSFINICDVNGNHGANGTFYIRGLQNSGTQGAKLISMTVDASSLYCTGDVYSSYSDVRLKKKTGSIENALEKVCSIETLYYEPNETAIELGVRELDIKVGVDAQSVQKVASEVVGPSAIDNRYLTVQYERLVPYLIEAIKEQQKEIQELKTKLLDQ